MGSDHKKTLTNWYYDTDCLINDAFLQAGNTELNMDLNINTVYFIFHP